MKEHVRAAQAGDTASWNCLYNHHYPWLFAVALRMCGNSPAAKEAVQETFVSAYLKLNQLRDPAAFSGWLKATLVRHCYKKKKAVSLCAADNSFSFEHCDLYDDEINRKADLYSSQIKIYNCLSCLSDTLQSVLLLRYFSEWQSYDEIARILCIPVGTVRSRLHLAKQTIMEQWHKSSDDNDTAYREAQQWNYLYNNYFSHIHSSLNHREKLMAHLDKNLHLVFTSGKTGFGRQVIEKEIEGDLLHGTSFGDVQVMSSGLLSIVEVENVNSKEYPDRCPENSILVLYRSRNKVTRMTLHNSY